MDVCREGTRAKGAEAPSGYITHYSLLTTHYSPLITHSSSLTTHYSPLTTHYSLLTTHYSLRTTTNPFTLPLQDGVVQEADDDGEDPPRGPTYEETLQKCREIIESASSGLEGERLALARLAYAAIIDSGFEDWSGEIFEWSDGWEEPGHVLTHGVACGTRGKRRGLRPFLRW